MQVKVEEIQAKGLSLEEPIKSSVLEEALKDSAGYTLVRSAPLKVDFRKVSGKVFVEGRFTAELEVPCKRCLKPVALSQPVAFSLRMESQVRDGRSEEGDDDEGGERAGSFELDDADVELFDGKTIALDPIVREQLLLALPTAVLCQDQCRGLCTICGQDLNEQECGCERKAVDVRLAALKNFKLQQ